MKELPKVYDPKQVEKKIYDMWMQGGYFKGNPDPDKKPFSIVMPPPNVTGQLHMGHALDATLQDILTRYKRMQGYAALWLPGYDHAGIATQIKVEENLRKEEGLTRYDLGREKFLDRVWAWKNKYGDRSFYGKKTVFHFLLFNLHLRIYRINFFVQKRCRLCNARTGTAYNICIQAVNPVVFYCVNFLPAATAFYRKNAVLLRVGNKNNFGICHNHRFFTHNRI